MAEILCPQCNAPNRDTARYCADCGAPLMPSVPVSSSRGAAGRPSTPTPGMILEERYRIESELGRGGFGAVFKAWDLRLSKWVAVKENLDASDEAQRQFAREAMTLANLSHPNLPRVIDHFIVPDRGQYLVMDFVDGQDLNSMIERQGALPPAQAAAWIAQVAEALEYLHSQEPPVLHRDIKPANIRVSPRGRAILVDFGLVKFSDPALKTTLGARAVTPGYAPPEQYGLGATDERTDLYALGATLYRALTGQEPIESVQRMVNQALPTAAQVNSIVPPALSQVSERAMQLNPADRYQSAVEFRAALQAGLAEIHPPSAPVVSAPSGTAPERTAPKRTADHPSAPRGAPASQPGTATAYIAPPLERRPVSHPSQGRPSRPNSSPTSETANPARRAGLPARLVGVLAAVLCLGVVLAGISINASGRRAASASATGQSQLTAIAQVHGTRAAQDERLAQETRRVETAQATGAYAPALQPSTDAGGAASTRTAATTGPSGDLPAATRRAPDAYLPPESLGQASLGAGPLRGELIHNVTNGRTETFSPRGVFANFVVETTFYNPYSPSRGAWDYGYLFRYVGANDHYRLIVSSSGEWSLRNKTNTGPAGFIKRGRLTNLKTEAGEANTLTLVCIDKQGWFYLNNMLVASLDLAGRITGGGIQIGAGFFDGAEITGQTTRYEDLTVWTLPAKRK